MKRAYVTLPLVLALTGCHRGPSPADQARPDFEAICTAQKEFVQSRKLLASVPEPELRAERDRRLAAHRFSEAGLAAVNLLMKAGPESARGPVENAAHAAGLSAWGCPEL